MKNYYPEGILFDSAENQNIIRNPEKLEEACAAGRTVEACAVVCDNEHNLIVDMPCMTGIIPHCECAAGIDDGSVKDVAVISKVSRPVGFKVIKIEKDMYGHPLRAVLSRRALQEECYTEYIKKLVPGDIVDARVTHNAGFGTFADIGCGIVALLPVDYISVSRIRHPCERFDVYEDIRVIIKDISFEKKYPRITLSHKELLGTWTENSSLFCVGETAAGIVRSVEGYGVFVELAPNLAGLAELRNDVHEGQTASVYIKAVIPEKMKMKLIISSLSDDIVCRRKIKYFTDAEHIDSWRYSPECCPRIMESVFTRI